MVLQFHASLFNILVFRNWKTLNYDMEQILGILGLIFLYMAFGAVWKVVKHQWCLTEKTKKETGLTSALSLILSSIILSHLLSLNWYWSVFINCIAIIPISQIAINIYTSLIGLFSYKRKIRFQLDEISLNTDSIVMLNIGIILFVIFACI